MLTLSEWDNSYIALISKIITKRELVAHRITLIFIKNCLHYSTLSYKPKSISILKKESLTFLLWTSYSLFIWQLLFLYASSYKFFQVSGEAGSESSQSSSGEAIHRGQVTSKPVLVNIRSKGEPPTSNVTVTTMLMATTVPTADVTTPEAIFRQTPAPLDFRLI